MRRQSLLTGLGFSLALLVAASRFAAAEEKLYEPNDYLDGCCDAASCDVPCGGCGGCLDCCSACCGWYAGAEAFWAQPRIKDNNAFTMTGSIPGTPPTRSTITTPYDYDYDITPRIWLGYADCCGAGFRASWWEYEDDSDPVVVPVAPNWIECRVLTSDLGAQTFSAQQHLELELADLELTNAFNLCGGCALVSYGVRYVRYASVTREQLDSGSVGSSVGSVSDAFDGFGPTLALEFDRPVSCRWSVYGKLRGTIALGDRDTTAGSAYLDTLAVPTRWELNSRSGEEAFAIAELQIGVQWNYCCWFVRAGWQAQYWDDAMEVAPLGGGLQPGTLGDIGVHGFNIAVGYGR